MYELDEKSIEILKEINAQNPQLIQISGCRNPTYSSDVFSRVLIDFGTHKIEAGSTDGGVAVINEVDELTIDWMERIIKSELYGKQVRKIQNIYIVMDKDVLESQSDEDNLDYLYHYGAAINIHSKR